MLHFVLHKNFQNRRVGIIENGSWATTAGKLIKAKLAELKDIEIIEPMVSILSAPTDTTWTKLDELAQSLINDIKK